MELVDQLRRLEKEAGNVEVHAALTREYAVDSIGVERPGQLRNLVGFNDDQKGLPKRVVIGLKTLE